MGSILLHRILSILHFPTVTRDSPTQQDLLPQALSLSSQDHRILAMVQLLVLAVLLQDNKDMKIQDQGSGLAWELVEY